MPIFGSAISVAAGGPERYGDSPWVDQGKLPEKHRESHWDEYGRFAYGASKEVLVQRLFDPKYSRDANQTVMVLDMRRGHKQDRVLFERFKEYIDKQLNSTSRLYVAEDVTISRMLGSMGELGGEKGLDYLIDWLSSEKYVSRISTTNFSMPPAFLRCKLSWAAVRGISQFPSRRSLSYLKKLKTKLPNHLSACESFSLDEPIEIQEELSAQGYDRYYSPEEQESREKRSDRRDEEKRKRRSGKTKAENR